MSIFKYKAKNEYGENIEGIVNAPNELKAKENVKAKKLELVSLTKENSFLNYSFSFIKPKDIVIFSRQFAVLISANVSLVESLNILIDQTENVGLRKVIEEVVLEVDEGARLSDSLSHRPNVFSPFYVNVVKSGETSGKLDEILNYLADELEKDYDMMSKIKGAMIYPAFVFTAMIAIGAIMMVFIVPKLTETLAQSGTELPLATKVVIAVSSFMANYWILFIALLIVLVIAFKIFLKTKMGKEIFDNILLRTPIFGNLFNKIFLVRFTRSFNTLLIGGVSIAEGLDICAKVVNNTIYTEIIMETKKAVEDGNSMSGAFLKNKMIPKMVPQMISIGEKTGKLDMILEKITNFYAREIENKIANLMSLLEPIIMVAMGIAVGIMVAAIILPMYNMAGSM